MKQSKFITILLLGILLISCSNMVSSKSNTPSAREISSLTDYEKSLIESSNKFSIDLFKNCLEIDNEKNIFISPLSVSYALGMAYNGAAGDTRNVIGDVLQIEDTSLSDFNSNYYNLIELLKNIDQDVDLKIANSFWYRKGLEIEKTFTENLTSYFDAQVTDLDFSSDQSAEIMNKWVSDKTNGKINSLITPPIDPLTRMYLINAIYFKGLWSIPFDPNSTAEKIFHKSDKTEIKCDMMQSDGEFEYFETDSFKAVNIYYGDNHFCLTILLPVDESAIFAISDQLTHDNFKKWSNQFKPTNLILNLPKFKFSYKINLSELLIDMGMSKAFNPNLADFSNIMPLNDLHLQNVIHKSFIELDETGTEATAATAISIGITSVGPVVKQFNANHPFLFLIREVESNTIIFAGAISEPAWER